MYEQATAKALEEAYTLEIRNPVEKNVQSLAWAISLLRDEIYALKSELHELKSVKHDIAAIRCYLATK